MSHGGDPDETLITPGGSKVPVLVQSPHLYLDKSIALYGPSKSGKTVYTRFIMHTLQPYISQGIIVSPTEPTNRSYSDCFPPQLIHYSCEIKGATDERGKPLKGKAAVEHFLKEIIERQTMRVGIYSRVCDLSALRRLYHMCRSNLGDSVYRVLSNARRTKLMEATRGLATVDEIDAAKAKINETFDEAEVKVLRRLIGVHRDALLAGKHGPVSKDDKYVLQYLNINPRLLLIFDDCAAELKQFFKTPEFRKLFYQGRHIGVTLIMSFQDDTDLDLNLRKNVFVGVYMTQDVATAAFSRSFVPKREQKYVADFASKLYSKRFRKLVYLREDEQRFYHTIVSAPASFRFGSDLLWQLCADVSKKKTALDTNNSYYSRFKL